MSDINLYNTLTKKKEKFEPIKKDQVGLYTCGPTVYNYAHIGNLRSYIFADILVKSLRYKFGSENVKWIMNITDVDDKTIRDSKLKYPNLDPMEALKKFTEEYESYFLEDMEKLNISRPDEIMHATKYIKEMKELVNKIVEKGYGYIKDGSIYFDVKKYSNNFKYGKLVNIDVANLKNGVSVDADEYEKENIQDFVLWKGRKNGEPYWEFELNNESLPGRPGWHIECSAMGNAKLGIPFDIHTGGIDLKFPHHENEIAQSVIGYGVDEPVKYWLHNEFLNVDGVKMSKRFNNFHTLRGIEEKGINPLAFRFLCLQTGYNKIMNFTWESLKAAEEGLNHLYNQLISILDYQYIDNNLAAVSDKLGNLNTEILNNFIDAINDDLNTPKSLSFISELLKSDTKKGDKIKTILEIDKMLGLNIIETITIRPVKIPTEIEELKHLREKYRNENNFVESDRLRDKIEKLGYIVEDTKDGQRIYKK